MRRSLVVLVLAALPLLAACAGSDDDAGAPARSTTAAAVPVASSAGCDAPAVAPGQTKVTITSRGTDRWFLQHVPAKRGPLPLVVDFHGYAEGAEVHTKLSELGPYGDEHGFVVLTPQGTGTPVRWDVSPGSADLTFAADLLDHAERTLCLDTNRVFVTGMSNGAFMTSSVACVLADRVAAVVPVAGIRDPQGCTPSRPVPILAIHGTADTFVGYDGGLGKGALDLPAPDGSGRTLREVGAGDGPKGPSIPEITAAWAKRDGCGTSPTTEEVTGDVDRLDYPCPKGMEVALLRVAGGGHAWPGSPLGPAIEKLVGRSTTSISADEVLWSFFRRHPLR